METTFPSSKLPKNPLRKPKDFCSPTACSVLVVQGSGVGSLFLILHQSGTLFESEAPRTLFTPARQTSASIHKYGFKSINTILRLELPYSTSLTLVLVWSSDA